jgi:hypothetical protein
MNQMYKRRYECRFLCGSVLDWLWLPEFVLVSAPPVATTREGQRWPNFHVVEGSCLPVATRRGALGASCNQQRPAHYVNGQIDLHHKASTTARGASGRNLSQGVVKAMALHVAHGTSYRS